MSETLNLPLRDWLRINEALNCLDASKRGTDEIVPFEFSAEVSWRLAKNACILERLKTTFGKRMRQIAAQSGLKPGESISVGGGEVPDMERLGRFAKFQDLVEEAKDVEEEVSGLLFVTLDELLTKPAGPDGKVGRNPIPQSVRNKLVPIIREGAK